MTGAILATILAVQLVAAPDQSVGPAQQAGVATYCAPTPKRCQSWGPPALLGAVQSFSFGDDPYVVTVCRQSGAPCVAVTVVSHCACGDRHGQPTVIDLSPAAFARLAPLSRGVIDVVLTVGGPKVTLPPTDTEPYWSWPGGGPR